MVVNMPVGQDEEIAEFHRAGRRRKIIAYAVATTLFVVMALTLVLYLFSADWSQGVSSFRGRGQAGCIVGSIVCTVLAAKSGIATWKLATGRVADIDMFRR